MPRRGRRSRHTTDQRNYTVRRTTGKTICSNRND